MGNVSPLPAAIRPSFVRALKGWYTRKGFPAGCVLTCLLLSAHRPAAGGRSQGIPSAGTSSILAGGSQPLQRVPSEVQRQQAQECCSVRTCRYPAGPVGTSGGFLKLPSPPQEAVAHPELHAEPHSGPQSHALFKGIQLLALRWTRGSCFHIGSCLNPRGSSCSLYPPSLYPLQFSFPLCS